MVSKVRAQSRFSLRVRMNRSGPPLPSGARTKAGELDPEKGDLLLELVYLILRAVIVAHSQTAGDRLGEPAGGAAVRPGGSGPGPGSG